MTRVSGATAKVGAAAAVVGGILLTRVLLSHYSTLCCDSQGYYDLAQALISRGPRALAAHIRTYGYPSFLAFLSLWRPRPIAWVHAAAATAQGALTGAAAVIAYLYARRASASRAIAAIVAGSVLLNPILIARASELLTEMLSAFLLFLALLPAIWSGSAGTTLRKAAASVFAASAAAAVRPANMMLLATILLYWLVRAMRSRPRFATRGVAAILLAGSIPLLPQMLINARYAGTYNPLVMSAEYRYQTIWGMRALKYSTFVEPGRPYLVYKNPFYDAAWRTPREFLAHAPARYTATLGIHGFALLDQDPLFTYITDLRPPWYRWPVSLANYGWMFLVLLGAACAFLRRGPCRENPDLRHAALLSAALCAIYLGFYLPTLVESRFSTPVYLLAVPLFLVGVALLAEILRKRDWRRGLRVGAGGLAFLAACASLSAWIQVHAVQNVDPRHDQPSTQKAS